ncbi:MAG: Magnesium and cobalt efflux protein CorC [Syntrophaceae bacterium PtaB.Bin038]|nr:MAG: Magnesium and cobalt efflux protein CorC [Syntrophaceae bacterium PtaB.Bin038]
MDPYVTFKLALMGLCLLLSGFFSSSEAALFSLTSLHLHKMREERFPFFSYVERLLDTPRRLLVTIIAGNEIVNIVLSATATALFISLFGERGEWITVAVLSPVLFLFGEAVPKIFGKTYSMRLSSLVAPLMSLIQRVEFPLVWLLEKISGFILGPLRAREAAEGETLMEDEFRSLVDAGYKEGILETGERDLIHRVFELADTPVCDIMTPRVDMFCMPLSASAAELRKKIIDQGYSRIPLYGTGPDDIVGILYTRDLLGLMAEGKTPASVEPLLRKPYFVPEKRGADQVLRDFQKRNMHLALVVDEYGGISGLVTLEDILEELFGDIYDERDTRERPIHRIDEKTLMVSGALSIDEFNAVAGTSIPSGDFGTVGGYVLHLFGRLPSRGDEIAADGLRLLVRKVKGTRILSVRVTREGEP